MDDFYKVAMVIGVAISGVWALLKITVSQHEKRIDSGLSALGAKLTAADNHLDKLIDEVRRIELKQAERDATNMRDFVMSRDFNGFVEQQNANSRRIYELLEKLSAKLEGKMDRADCRSCVHVDIPRRRKSDFSEDET